MMTMSYDCLQGTVTQQQLSPDQLASMQAAATADETQASTRAQLRAQIIAQAQTAVGVPLGQLTAVQVRSLLACMLYALGGVDPATMAVVPLDRWVAR